MSQGLAFQYIARHWVYNFTCCTQRQVGKRKVEDCVELRCANTSQDRLVRPQVHCAVHSLPNVCTRPVHFCSGLQVLADMTLNLTNYTGKCSIINSTDMKRNIQNRTTLLHMIHTIIYNLLLNTCRSCMHAWYMWYILLLNKERNSIIIVCLLASISYQSPDRPSVCLHYNWL